MCPFLPGTPTNCLCHVFQFSTLSHWQTNWLKQHIFSIPNTHTYTHPHREFYCCRPSIFSANINWNILKCLRTDALRLSKRVPPENDFVNDVWSASASTTAGNLLLRYLLIHETKKKIHQHHSYIHTNQHTRTHLPLHIHPSHIGKPEPEPVLSHCDVCTLIIKWSDA